MNRVRRFLFLYNGGTTTPTEPIEESGIPESVRSDFMAKMDSIVSALNSYIVAHPDLQSDPNAEGAFETSETYSDGSDPVLNESSVSKSNETSRPNTTFASPASWAFDLLNVGDFQSYRLDLLLYPTSDNGNLDYQFLGSLSSTTDTSNYNVFGSVFGGENPGVLSEAYNPPLLSLPDEVKNLFRARVATVTTGISDFIAAHPELETDRNAYGTWGTTLVYGDNETEGYDLLVTKDNRPLAAYTSDAPWAFDLIDLDGFDDYKVQIRVRAADFESPGHFTYDLTATSISGDGYKEFLIYGYIFGGSNPGVYTEEEY